MPEEQGTRETKAFCLSHPSSRTDNMNATRDKGMSKRVVASATMVGPVLTDAASNFTVFKVYDMITITGTQGGLNNGDRTILGVTTTTITCDASFKSEGPTANVEVRTI